MRVLALLAWLFPFCTIHRLLDWRQRIHSLFVAMTLLKKLEFYRKDAKNAKKFNIKVNILYILAHTDEYS